MEKDGLQKELFEFESPKKAAARFGTIFTRPDFAIILTPEKMVFTAIGVIMLMVIFFALGVEKGRSAAEVSPAPAISVSSVRVPVVAAKSIAATNITPKVNPPALSVKAPAVFDKTKPYMVVAGAFSKQDLALKEVGKLKTAGLEAYVYYGEPYYLACVGSFQNKDAAGKILNKVRHMHKDAYVRLR
jgi:cell division septation protein DedD